METLLLPIIIGNLSALSVSALAWWLRQKCLRLIVFGGMFGFPAFVFVVTRFCVESEREFRELMSGGICGEAYKAIAPPHYAQISFLQNSCWAVLASMLLLGFIQQHQISVRYWQAALAVGGEIVLGGAALWCGYYAVSQASLSVSWLYWGFGVTWVVLSLFRPFCLHWVRPVLRSMSDTGKPLWAKRV